MPAVTYSIVTLTLDYSYGLTPPVYLMASWTHRPWAASLMLVKNWQHETEYQSERHEFEISLNIPPGPCLYRYRLGYEDSESFICDHQEKIGNS